LTAFSSTSFQSAQRLKQSKQANNQQSYPTSPHGQCSRVSIRNRDRSIGRSAEIELQGDGWADCGDGAELLTSDDFQEGASGATQ
jgi:hypothetical protein